MPMCDEFDGAAPAGARRSVANDRQRPQGLDSECFEDSPSPARRRSSSRPKSATGFLGASPALSPNADPKRPWSAMDARERRACMAGAGAVTPTEESYAQMFNYIMLAKRNKELISHGTTPQTPSLSFPADFPCFGPGSPSRLRRPMSAGCIRTASKSKLGDTFDSLADEADSPNRSKKKKKKKASGKDRPSSADACSPSRAKGCRPVSAPNRRRRNAPGLVLPKSAKHLELAPLTKEEDAWLAATLAAVPRFSVVSQDGTRRVKKGLAAAVVADFQSEGDTSAPKRGAAIELPTVLSRTSIGVTKDSKPDTPTTKGSVSPAKRKSVPDALSFGMCSAPSRRQGSMGGGPVNPRASTRASVTAVSCEHMMAEGPPGTGSDAGVYDHQMRLLKRLKVEEQGFEEEDIARMRGGYDRLIFPGTGEVHVDDLVELLINLGHTTTTDEHVKDLCAQLALLNTVSFDEFLRFMTLYLEVEHDVLRGIFDSYDLDKNGNLSVDELEGLYRQKLNITPLREALLEALRLVDTDLNGSLDFDEFIELIWLLRATEGFGNKDISRIRRIFDRCARPELFPGEAREMDPSRLVESLCHMFGPQATDTITRMVHNTTIPAGMDTSAHAAKYLTRRPPPEHQAGKTKGVSFQEFLQWARLHREAEMEEYFEHFKDFDADGSSLIDGGELANLMQKLGYTPLQRVVEDLLIEVTGDPDAEVNFDDFLKLLDLFRARDGFTQEEVDSFRRDFGTFVSDGKEEMTCLELMGLLRHLGFQPKLNEVHKFIDEVEFNANQMVDFREFLRLMRVMREDELQRAQKAFDVFKSDDENLLLPTNLRAAMLATDARWSKLPKETFQTLLRDHGEPEEISFDLFAEIIEGGRGILSAEMRQQAGFSDKEIEHFKELFATYDSDKNGSIERGELTGLLMDLQIPMRSLNDQHAMQKMLREARQSARDAGLENDDEGEEDKDNHLHVTFWVLVYLLRIMCNKEDQREIDLEDDAIRDTAFEKKEINEFRDIFEYWVEVENSTKSQQTPCGRYRKSKSVAQFGLSRSVSAPVPGAVPGLSRSASGMVRMVSDESTMAAPRASRSNSAKFDDGAQPSVARAMTAVVPKEEVKKHLSVDGASRLLRSLNLSLSLEQLTELENKIFHLDPIGCGRLDFPCFLRLIKWLLDTNFAEINCNARQLAESAK